MKSYLKKALGAALVLCLTMMLGFSVLAAPSPIGSGIIKEATAVTQTGKSLKLAVTEASKSISIEEAKKVLGSSFEEGMTIMDIKDLKVVEGELTPDDFPLTLTIAVPNVVPTTKVAVLHKPDGATEWQKENSKAGDGIITVSGIMSLSPFAILVDQSTLGTAAGSTSGAVSPKTGETGLPLILGMIAAAAVCGACVSFKKRADVK